MASRLQDVIQRGLAADRPLATAVAPGTLYYSTDTITTDRSDGTSWETYADGGAVATPELLAFVAYNPGSLTTATTTSATPADLDTVNLAITFTVPASGSVLVGLGALANLGSGATGYVWMLRDTLGNTITNSRCQVCGASAILVRPNYRVVITGLTPGAVTTWRWAHAITAVVATGNTFYGDAGAANPRGPAVMEVWAA